MDADLTPLGLFYVELGTLVALGFRPDPGSDVTKMGRGGEKILGTSTVGTWFNGTFLPRLGIRFHSRVPPDEAQKAITVQGEIWLHRLGWTAVFVGMTLQLLDQGPW